MMTLDSKTRVFYRKLEHRVISRYVIDLSIRDVRLISFQLSIATSLLCEKHLKSALSVTGTDNFDTGSTNNVFHPIWVHTVKDRRFKSLSTV